MGGGLARQTHVAVLEFLLELVGLLFGRGVGTGGGFRLGELFLEKGVVFAQLLQLFPLGARASSKMVRGASGRARAEQKGWGALRYLLPQRQLCLIAVSLAVPLRDTKLPAQPLEFCLRCSTRHPH